MHSGSAQHEPTNGPPSPLGSALDALARLRREPAIDIGDLEPGWRTAASVFCDDGTLETLLAAQAAFTVDLDRKAQAAYLVIELGMMLSVASVVPLLVSGVVPSTSPDDVALRFHAGPVEHHGRVVEETKGSLRLLSPRFRSHDARWTGHPHCVALPDHAALLDHLRIQVEAFSGPLIRALHRLTALPANAMWRLVGDAVSAVFLEAGRMLGCEEQAKSDALAVLKRPGSPLANRQMHFFDIVIRSPDEPGRILASRSFRSRGGCCRYYTSREGRLCTTCVLLDPADRDRDLEAALRARLGLAASAPAHPG